MKSFAHCPDRAIQEGKYYIKQYIRCHKPIMTHRNYKTAFYKSSKRKREFVGEYANDQVNPHAIEDGLHP